MISFVDWLQAEMDRRNLSQHDLARLAHVSQGTIGNIIRGERKPGLVVCMAIAQAFDMDPAEVLRIARHLPTKAETDAVIEQVIYEMGFLSMNDKKEVLEFVRMKKRIIEQRAKFST